MEEIHEELASEVLTVTKILLYIFYALAMGVAIVVLPLVGQSADQSLSGVALLCLAMAGLIQVTGK